MTHDAAWCAMIALAIIGGLLAAYIAWRWIRSLRDDDNNDGWPT